MDGQDDIARVVIDVRHNVRRAQQLLTAAHIDTRRIPSGLEVRARPVKSGIASTGSTRWTSLSRASQGLHAPERGFPAPLELGCYKPVLRVAGGIAALGERCLIKRAHVPPKACRQTADISSRKCAAGRSLKRLNKHAVAKVVELPRNLLLHPEFVFTYICARTWGDKIKGQRYPITPKCEDRMVV